MGDGRTGTPFRLTGLSATEAVFENPQHDYPQRIIYRKSGNRLDARIEGVDKGKARSEDFPMEPVSCR
jgi:hypothetical protein